MTGPTSHWKVQKAKNLDTSQKNHTSNMDQTISEMVLWSVKVVVFALNAVSVFVLNLVGIMLLGTWLTHFPIAITLEAQYYKFTTTDVQFSLQLKTMN